MSIFSNKKCKCHEMDIRVTGWRTDDYFKKMKSIGSKDDGWRTIVLCDFCRQYWLVDEYDKLQYLYAFKIDNPEDINDDKIFELHKLFLLKTHGGESVQYCQMASCKMPLIADVRFLNRIL